MHGELIEFNERLYRSLMAKDHLINQMKQELIDLRGPVSYPLHTHTHTGDCRPLGNKSTTPGYPLSQSSSPHLLAQLWPHTGWLTRQAVCVVLWSLGLEQEGSRGDVAPSIPALWPCLWDVTAQLHPLYPRPFSSRIDTLKMKDKRVLTHTHKGLPLHVSQGHEGFKEKKQTDYWDPLQPCWYPPLLLELPPIQGLTTTRGPMVSRTPL